MSSPMLASTSAPPALSLPLRTPRLAPRVAVYRSMRHSEHLRFTLDGSAELEQHLAVTCQRIAPGVRGLLPASKLEAILLGGGYGRGEGGVWRTAAGDRPYNDLEFYVFLRGNRHVNEIRYGRALHVLGEILTPQAGVDVELKIASRRELAAATVSMFSYDLVVGHHCIAGAHDWLTECAHHRNAGLIPVAEASRLLMNRCSGLLFAAERLSRATFTAGDSDFVARNIAKAELGIGDAVLTVFGRYHWSVRERRQRLQRLLHLENAPWFDAACRHHALGTEFKLHPHRSEEPRAELAARHASVSALAREVWLWTESRRLERSFNAVEAYVADPQPKCPEASPLRSALINAKIFRGCFLKADRVLRHPRERVLHALPLLLWPPENEAREQTVARVQRELQTDATDFADLVAAYHSLWSQLN